MIGIVVLGLAAVSFFVSIMIGLTLTLTGFAVSKKKQLSCNALRVWLIAVLSTVVLMAIILLLTVSVSSGGSPTVERYEEMTKALALWALVPGAALAVGGIALFSLRSEQSKTDD